MRFRKSERGCERGKQTGDWQGFFFFFGGGGIRGEYQTTDIHCLLLSTLRV